MAVAVEVEVRGASAEFLEMEARDAAVSAGGGGLVIVFRCS